ncbi:MAG: flagellar protein FlaG [Desulfovibrionaceae bacterium]
MDVHKNLEAQAAYPHANIVRGSERTQDQQQKGDNPRAQGRIAEPSEKKSASVRLDRDTVERMLHEAQEEMEKRGVELHFKLSEEADTVQVEVRDPQNGKVIRKIPEDELVRLSANIKGFAGAFLDRPI